MNCFACLCKLQIHFLASISESFSFSVLLKVVAPRTIVQLWLKTSHSLHIWLNWISTTMSKSASRKQESEFRIMLSLIFTIMDCARALIRQLQETIASFLSFIIPSLRYLLFSTMFILILSANGHGWTANWSEYLWFEIDIQEYWPIRRFLSRAPTTSLSSRELLKQEIFGIFNFDWFLSIFSFGC